MDRRTLLTFAGGLLAIPHLLFAQPAQRVYRIVIFDNTREGTRRDEWTALRNRLRELGLVEGRNLVIEERYANGISDRLNSLAAEIVATKPDLILTPGTPTTRAVLRATSNIPIVFAGAADPAGAGLVASLARPGGNATGVSTMGTETSQKTLEFLRELLPGAQRIGFLTDTSSQSAALAYSRLEEKARSLKLSIQMLDGIGRTALDRAFATIRRERIQGLLVAFSAGLLEHKDEIIQFAAREKLPVVYARNGYVSAGGLMSYAMDPKSRPARAADLVHKILHGAKPADLPVEQINKTRLEINMKTARALGIKIPESVRLRVDEVIE